MNKTIAPKGSSEAFLRSLVGTDALDCIPWPYRLSANGYGLATIGGVQRPASNWMCRLSHGDPFSIWKSAAHSCHKPDCVNPNHLRWATHAENMADRVKDGTTNRGARNGKTRLTEDDVRAIRAAPPSLAPLMARYGMSRDGICKIRTGKRWGHVIQEYGDRHNVRWSNEEAQAA